MVSLFCPIIGNEYCICGVKSDFFLREKSLGQCLESILPLTLFVVRRLAEGVRERLLPLLRLYHLRSDSYSIQSHFEMTVVSCEFSSSGRGLVWYPLPNILKIGYKVLISSILIVNLHQQVEDVWEGLWHFIHLNVPIFGIIHGYSTVKSGVYSYDFHNVMVYWWRERESNPHEYPLDFESSASTISPSLQKASEEAHL